MPKQKWSLEEWLEAWIEACIGKRTNLKRKEEETKKNDLDKYLNEKD